jgi:hypothetical protein
MRKRCWMYLAGAVMLSGLIFSHVGKMGSINGIVMTPEGDPLPGVIVLLRSPALILPELEAVSDESGVYRFPSLSPGVYELSFIIKGLESHVRKGIIVLSGKTVSLDARISFKASGKAVVVEEKAPVTVRLRTVGATTGVTE